VEDQTLEPGEQIWTTLKEIHIYKFNSLLANIQRKFNQEGLVRPTIDSLNIRCTQEKIERKTKHKVM
jgi:hypothetical protein